MQVAVWDIDEFLVPRSPGRVLPELIHDYTDVSNTDGKETCFLRIDSFSLKKADSVDSRRKWFGESYAAGRDGVHNSIWTKSIVSTNHSYYIGFHMPGACATRGRDWTEKVHEGLDRHYSDYVRHMRHEEAAMFHFRGSPHMFSNRTEASEYSLYHFARVLEGLERRSVETILESL
jgi:hypothetical protein